MKTTGKTPDAIVRPTSVSIAIFAWNEERTIALTLNSLFRQTLFAELAARGSSCEVLCVANGCADDTAGVASRFFDQQSRIHPAATGFSCRAVNLTRRGKINAWNTFVHSLASTESKFMFFMDADIQIDPPESLWNMLTALELHPEARASVDRPIKVFAGGGRSDVRVRLSTAASRLTAAAEAQLCGQLYCLRAETARGIYLPNDLSACEDGFIKWIVCTDSLSRSYCPDRIVLANNAAHSFEAYTSPAVIFRNQKRQAIGQTIVHALIDDYLKQLPSFEREHLAETLRRKDVEDPSWLKRLIAGHLQRRKYFWRLYPGQLGYRFRNWSRLGFVQKVLCFPTAIAATAVSLASSFMAYKFLKAGSTDYWPQVNRSASRPLDWPAQGALHFGRLVDKQQEKS